MIINPRILLLKLGLQINAANYFKYQRRPSSRLATVMFRGTLGIKKVLFRSEANDLRIILILLVLT